jgi:uncharacterized protein YbjQ (UPF0145 family)
MLMENMIMRVHAMFLLGLALVALTSAEARDTKLMLPIAEAMSTPEAREKLQGDIRFFFGDQVYPEVKERLGQGVSNRKTNAANKTDKRACEWAFLSALLAMQERARGLGADAVVSIESYYRKIPVKSATEYECHAGAVIAGVALKGEFVKLAK